MLISTAKELKSRVTADMDRLLNPQDAQTQFELIFKKLEEETVNPKLLQPFFVSESKQPANDFMLPPPAIQDDSLFAVVNADSSIKVDEVRARLAAGKIEFDELRVRADGELPRRKSRRTRSTRFLPLSTP